MPHLLRLPLRCKIIVSLQLLLLLLATRTYAWTVCSISSHMRPTHLQMAKVSGIESTPNPSSFLVQLSEPLEGLKDMAGSLKGRTFSSSSPQSSAEVASILEIDGIESVYAMATALTINKRASAKWEQILPLVLNELGADAAEISQQLLQGLLAPATTGSQTETISSGQVRMRMQISNKIPIQIEATGFLGTAQRMKLPPKFQENMELMLKGGIEFFAGRTWVDRGVRYLPDDDRADTASQQDEERQELELALQTELEEMDAAYSPQRLAAIVAESLGETQQPTSSVSLDTGELDLETVYCYCDLAEQGNMEALAVLSNFVSCHQGSMSARRNAVAFLGGTGGITAVNVDIVDLVFYAIVSALQNEKNPVMRRTAGDALSDLGDPRAVQFAVKALEDRSKLVQWRGARILGELSDTPDIVAILKQASFSSKFAFEVAFEIKDALRKVQARVQSISEGGAINGAPGTGPMWKQIQEGMDSSSTNYP